MERVNNGEVVNVTFFVSQDDRKVPASEAVQAYQRLTKAELGNFINFEVSLKTLFFQFKCISTECLE